MILNRFRFRFGLFLPPPGPLELPLWARRRQGPRPRKGLGCGGTRARGCLCSGGDTFFFCAAELPTKITYIGLFRPIDRFEGSILVAHDCGYPLSRYTCRATRVGVALHPPKILVAHLPPPPVPGGVAPNFGGLKRCRATQGCRCYSCGCRASLCN